MENLYVNPLLFGFLVLGSLSFGMYYGHYVLPDSLLDVYKAFCFLFKGREMIRKATKIYGETPFSLPMPGTRIHFFSSKEHYMELNKSHTADLSLHVAIKEILSPPYTLGGFQIPDRRDTEGMHFVRALRSTNTQLPQYMPKFFNIVEEDFNEAFQNAPIQDGFAQIPMSDMLRKSILRVNTLFILSEEAAYNPEFLKRGMSYTYRALLAAEICRSVPAWMKGIVSYAVQGQRSHQKYCFREISKQAEKFVAERRTKESHVERRGTLSVLENLTRCCPHEWTLNRVVQEVATAWMPGITLFSSVLINVIMDLGVYSEYIPALRAELALHWKDSMNFDTNSLILLEAFMTESARMHSYESGNIHRVARRDYTFEDGYQVSKGEWVEFNQQAIFSSARLFPEPEKFDPYRHLESGRKFKDVAMEWPMWGAPRLACPGRFMADRFIKVVAVHLLLNYDMKLSRNTGLNFEWRESEVPSPIVKLLLRKRDMN